jgi:hypothetical protein
MKNFIVILALLLVVNHVDALAQALVRSPSRASEINALKTQMNGTIALTDFSSRTFSDLLLNGVIIEGTPYAKDETSTGYFYMKDSVIITPTKLNYYANGFEFKAGDKTYVATAASLDSVVVDKETYVYRIFGYNGEKPSRKLVKRLYLNGKNALYEYKMVDFIQETKPGPLVDHKPAHFEWKEPLYLYEIDYRIIPLTNFKELIKTFPGKEKEINKFIKLNSIHTDSPLHLQVLLDYVSKLK